MRSEIENLINLSKDEKEKEITKGPVQKIAHDVFEFADETVAHAEGVSREDLMLECYHVVGRLLAEWSKNLDKIERVYSEPSWLREHIDREEKESGRSWVDFGSEAFGFEVDNLFFARERSNEKLLSKEILMVSEPYTMWMDDFKELINFCSKNGLDFYIDGFNTNQPGRTFRVVVYKPKTVPKTHREFREKALDAILAFDSLSQMSERVSKRSLIKNLVESGKFADAFEVERLIDTLVASGRISRLRISD